MRGLQWIRRFIQASVLALLVLVPVLAHYDNLRAQRDEQGIEGRWDTRLLHAVLEDVEAPDRFTRVVRGSVWTLRVGEHVVSDPLAVLDFMAASRVPWDVFLLSALLPLLASVLLGRVFCGWICPADLLFEIGSVVRRWVGIDTDVTFSSRLKYAVLGAGVVLALIAGTQVFAEIYPPRLVGAELYLWLTLGIPGVGAWFLLAVLAFEIFVSRRFWCRYVCPGGALYSLLGRWRIVRLRLNSPACTRCRECTDACEFGLDPMAGHPGQECNNCGVCVRACAHDALSWRAVLPGRPDPREEP
jgi:ferredoxin-type protein NapH